MTILSEIFVVKDEVEDLAFQEEGWINLLVIQGKVNQLKDKYPADKGYTIVGIVKIT